MSKKVASVSSFPSFAVDAPKLNHAIRLNGPLLGQILSFRGRENDHQKRAPWKSGDQALKG
jgi:hypothetical protein